MNKEYIHDDHYYDKYNDYGCDDKKFISFQKKFDNELDRLKKEGKYPVIYQIYDDVDEIVKELKDIKLDDLAIQVKNSTMRGCMAGEILSDIRYTLKYLPMYKIPESLREKIEKVIFKTETILKNSGTVFLKTDKEEIEHKRLWDLKTYLNDIKQYEVPDLIFKKIKKLIQFL